MNKLFVYGILKGVYKNPIPASLWGASKFFRGHATFAWDENYCLIGEVIEVDDKTLLEIDKIEGVDVGYYHRFLVEVEDDMGNILKDVWVYQQVEDKI